MSHGNCLLSIRASVYTSVGKRVDRDTAALSDRPGVPGAGKSETTKLFLEPVVFWVTLCHGCLLNLYVEDPTPNYLTMLLYLEIFLEGDHEEESFSNATGVLIKRTG